MLDVIFWLSLWLITNGFIWSIFSFLFKKWFEISFPEWSGLMFDRLAGFSVTNIGASLIITGLLGLIFAVVLSRFGIFNKLKEKIDEIGRFNKFRIMPRFINYNNDFDPSKPTYFSVVVQVKNIGHNISKLTDWSLTFIDQNGKKLLGTPLYHRGEIEIKGANNTPIGAFTEDWALYKKTTNSIEPGNSIIGVIQFLIVGLTNPINSECIIILNARDNKDRKIESKTKLSAINDRGPQLIAELHELSANGG